MISNSISPESRCCHLTCRCLSPIPILKAPPPSGEPLIPGMTRGLRDGFQYGCMAFSGADFQEDCGFHFLWRHRLQHHKDHFFGNGNICHPELQTEFKDPVSLRFKNNSMRLTGGMRLNLGPIYLNGDYTLQEYSTVSVGIGAIVRIFRLSL